MGCCGRSERDPGTSHHPCIRGLILSAFLPTCGDNELWSFGEEAYKIMKEYIMLRERLKPYIMKQMEKAHVDGTPVMRPLFYDFHKDEKVYNIGDEYMFGPHLLVAPVIEEGTRARMVYLPEGSRWTDAWSKEKFTGGTWVETEAPIERIPLYLRDDADLPIAE